MKIELFFFSRVGSILISSILLVRVRVARHFEYDLVGWDVGADYATRVAYCTCTVLSIATPLWRPVLMTLAPAD